MRLMAVQLRKLALMAQAQAQALALVLELLAKEMMFALVPRQVRV